MVRCTVYITNQSSQPVKCVNFAGSDWHVINDGRIPPGTERFAVGAMDCPEGLDSNYGTLFMQRDYQDTTKYFQIYFQLRNKDDCMHMGSHGCEKDSAEAGHPTAFNTDMPSDGRENAGVETETGTMWWFPAKSNHDFLGWGGAPVMQFFVNDHK